MKLIEKLLGKFGYVKREIIDEKPNPFLVKFPFLERALAINKKIIDDEKERIELFNNQKLYEDIALLVNKHFEDQNESLKKKILSLENEISILRDENKGLIIENEIFKKSN